MSKVVRALAGVAATVVGILTQQSWLVSIGLSLVASALLSPSLGGETERQASETTLQLGEVPRQVLFGRAATAGSLMDAFNYGGDDGTDWEVLLIALADHECDALEKVWVSDDEVTFAGNGPVAGYNNQLEIHFLPGTATQTWPSLVTSNGPGWTNTDNAAGVACAVVAYKADDPEADNPVWPGGRPRFLFQLRGKKCYIPSKDSTVTGGTGTHRYDDPTTWEWTQSAAECRYQFLRGIYALDRVDQPEMLLLGRGLSEIEAPPERSIAYAATCNEDVALKAGGTEKRYTFNGLISADENFLQAESYFAEAMGGIILQPEGGVEVEPGQSKAVVAEITDLDILNDADVTVEKFRGEADLNWINTVTPRYVEPGQKWTMHSAPIRRVYADVIEDGGPRVASPELKAVTSGTQAQRIGEIKRKLGRLTKTATIPLGPRFAFLEEGDWIGWTSARHFDGARVVFRVESFARDEKWQLVLTLREIAADVYTYTAATDESDDQTDNTQQTAPAALTAPGVSAWTAVAGNISGSGGQIPSIAINGAVDRNTADQVRFEYRVDGTTPWTHFGDFGPGLTSTTITSVADMTAYEVAVSYLVDGEVTPRRVIDAGTTSSISAASGSYDEAALDAIEQRLTDVENQINP